MKLGFVLPIVGPAISDAPGEHVHRTPPTLRGARGDGRTADAERALTSVVIDARAGGASWADIGKAAGVKRTDTVTAVDESVPAPSAPEPAPRPQRLSDRAHVTARTVRVLAHELTGVRRATAAILALDARSPTDLHYAAP
jgi:hypothetical protein